MQRQAFKKMIRMNRKPSRRGFTLVEVLVVLAILVILFGLLFAPMMTGMDMATQGRKQAHLQDVARQAAEQMRRELTTAMYIYPPPTYLTDTGAAVTDYSQIVFVPPATDPSGEPVTPRQPRKWTDPVTSVPEFQVVRYFVKPPDLSGGRTYDESNPFVLMRQEGLYRFNTATGTYEFGSINPNDGLFYPGLAMAENAVTPREDYDIPATTSLCLAPGCNRMEVGYVEECPSCTGAALVYLHEDIKFQPARITGEALVASENNTSYEARHGNWMGLPNNGTALLTPTALSVTDSELQPRLVVYRWNAVDDAYTTIALDSFSAQRSNISLRWDSSTGSVRVGNWRTVHIHVDASGAPGPGEFWTLDVEGDSYSGVGSLAGAQTAPLVPLYPKAPTEWGEPRMPIAYRIEPGLSDGLGVPAKIVPGSTRVTVLATMGTEANRAQYTQVQEINQALIGMHEYGEYMSPDQLWGEVRFNRFEPPSPDQFPGLQALDIYISYYYRRNFDPAAAPYRDDVMYADYSTGEIINITLIPQRFTDLEPYRDGLPNLVVPPDLPVGGVPVRTQAVVQNARR